MGATCGAVWRAVQDRLVQHGLDPAPQEGRALVAHVVGCDLSELIVREQESFPALLLGALDRLVDARLTGQPLAYVLGTAPFWNRDWAVGPGVLIPRPDTEIVVNVALHFARRLERVVRFVEVGVGSGCIVGTLLDELPMATAVGTDVSSVALSYAAQNVQAAGVAERCTLCLTDLLAGVEGPFDMVVSNPPYITDGEWDVLEPCVAAFEPRVALTGDMPNGDGLLFYKRLVAEGVPLLVPGGLMVVEIGATQGPAVAALWRAAGLRDVTVVPDLAGRDRVVWGVK